MENTAFDINVLFRQYGLAHLIQPATVATVGVQEEKENPPCDNKSTDLVDPGQSTGDTKRIGTFEEFSEQGLSDMDTGEDKIDIVEGATKLALGDLVNYTEFEIIDETEDLVTPKVEEELESPATEIVTSELSQLVLGDEIKRGRPPKSVKNEAKTAETCSKENDGVQGTSSKQVTWKREVVKRKVLTGNETTTPRRSGRIKTQGTKSYADYYYPY